MATYVFGHTTPDSDSIVGAIALSHLKNRLGENTISARQGKINLETKFILDKFDFEAPLLKKEYKGESVYLVDFMERSQSPKDIDEATILGIVDHHKLGDLTTSSPLEMWVRPVGCTNTIIKQMFDFYGLNIPKNLAGIMACAILSDTVIFKSPTSTDEDIKACEELSKIAGIEDIKSLGMEMFTVKSDVLNDTKRNLILRDFKDFNMGKKRIGIGQLEVVNLSVFDKMKEELFAEMETLRLEEKRDAVMLMLTDIMKEGTELLIVGNISKEIAESFGKKMVNSQIWLPKVMSRKKQIVPFLEKRFNR